MSLKYFKLFSQYFFGVINQSHPSYLVFFITSRCNCCCQTCFNWRNVQDKKIHQIELTLPAIQKIALSMKPLPQLLLSGGEPFLRQDIAQIVSVFYLYSETRQISIPTNGVLTQKIIQDVNEMLIKCPEAYFNINISLDGIGRDHDISCGLEGCFVKLCETVKELEKLREKNKRLVIQFITVVKKSNLDKVSEITKFVSQNFKANAHQLSLIRGDICLKGEKDIEIEHVKKVLDSIDKYKVKNNFKGLPFVYRLTPCIMKMIKKTIFETMKQKKCLFRCLAGKKMVVITPDGKLMPCEPIWLEQEARFGKNIKEYIMADLVDFDYDVTYALSSPQAKKALRLIVENKCYCLYGCAILNSCMYNPLMYPRILLELCFPS